MPQAYPELLQLLRRKATFSSIGALLGWDQETMMPPAAAGFRAEELALISSLEHETATSSRIGELLALCESDNALLVDPVAAANLREIRRDYDRACKLPMDLVVELSETSSLAMEAWKQARADSDFGSFRPWLEKQVSLNRRKAECYGFPDGGDLYDALLADFEPDMTGREVERLFGPLRAELIPLIEQVAACKNAPDSAPGRVRIPVEKQHKFNTEILEAIGFRTGAGRLDVSTHPFSTGIAPGDTRITTRYSPDQFLDALGSTMHEAGHALYEQGLPRAQHFGQPLGETLGLGIHESQSRMWENHVGRSRAFMKWLVPRATQALGPELGSPTVDDLYGAANIVKPHLIRVESDEATYNLHIMLRFDLERAMILGDLKPADLPGAWNERIRNDLGLEVPDDAHGCLQDIHWAMGALGYFPSYTLGNLYSAQFWDAVSRERTDLEGEISRGEFGGLLDWLRTNIHAHGRRFSADDLCLKLSGSALSHAPLMAYMKHKFGSIYGLDGQASVSIR